LRRIHANLDSDLRSSPGGRFLGRVVFNRPETFQNLEIGKSGEKSEKWQQNLSGEFGLADALK
jgi:hypothetical protein